MILNHTFSHFPIHANLAILRSNSKWFEVRGVTVEAGSRRRFREKAETAKEAGVVSQRNSSLQSFASLYCLDCISRPADKLCSTYTTFSLFYKGQSIEDSSHFQEI